MKKTTKIAIGIVIAILILGGIWLSVSKKPAPTETKKDISPIKIGVFTPLTGDAAIYGEALRNGLNLAMENINNQGGVLGKNIELIYEDSHLDSTTAVSIINKFINVDKFSIIIAAEGSGATLATAPLADKTKTVLMVPIATTAELKDSGDYVFRVVPSDAYRGKEMARLAEQKNYKKIGILYVNDAYGVGIKNLIGETVKDSGKEIVSAESFESGSVDFKSQLTKIKFSNPDVIMIEARKEYPNILKQIKELGIKSQLIASEVVETSILKEAGNAAEGMLAIDFAVPTDYVNFKTKYKNKYGVEAPLYSDFGYDALGALGVAIKNADSTDSEKVKNALYKTEYQGATGMIKFDSFGEVMEKPFATKQVKNGEFVELK